MSFHAHSGWHFARLGDGTVSLQRRSEEGWIKLSVAFDPGTWASVVASVSALGETRETHDMASALHAGTRVELITELVASDSLSDDEVDRLAARLVERLCRPPESAIRGNAPA